MKLISALSMVALLTLLSAAAGCRTGTSPYAPPAEIARNTVEAQQLTQQAARLMEEQPDKPNLAEELLRQALAADLYHGPAHNNLGVIYLKQGKLYEAASEFEWAKRLMPGHPDPRLNLGVTLERAGRTDDALTEYTSALDSYPDHLPTVQALARLQLRASRTDDRTRNHLRQIALRGDPAWRDWARRMMARFDERGLTGDTLPAPTDGSGGPKTEQ